MMMLRTSLCIGIVLVVICCKVTTSDSPCGPEYTFRECMRIILPTAKRTASDQSPNLLLGPDWIGSTECKLRDIYAMIPVGCRQELLDVLRSFVTNSDY